MEDLLLKWVQFCVAGAGAALIKAMWEGGAYAVRKCRELK